MLALEINNLRKIYASGLEALHGISFQVNEGDFFALLGPNGAGKSTTIGIITTLVTKTSGSVKVFGHDIINDHIAAKACIGLVPQELNFNTFETVLDIVVNQGGFYGVPRKLALTRAEKYLTQLGLWGKRNSPSRTLSGGMKRRLMIARALIHEPRMLILDEPTAGVDIEIRRSTWEFLTNINKQGITVILTTHYLEEAELLCRGIGIIDKGNILTLTTVKKILKQMQQYTLVLDLQQAIFTLPVIADCLIHKVDDYTLEVSIPCGKSVNEIFSVLTSMGVQVMSLRNKANRLEELFINLIRHGSKT